MCMNEALAYVPPLLSLWGCNLCGVFVGVFACLTVTKDAVSMRYVLIRNVCDCATVVLPNVLLIVF